MIGRDLRQCLAEAQIVAKLDHAHILPVFDVGSTDEFPLYIDGETLGQRI